MWVFKKKKRKRGKWKRKSNSKGRSHDLCGSAVSWLKAILSEGAGGEIKTDGKTAGPREQQSTVSRAWSRCWSNPAVSGSSHTSSPTGGSRLGSLLTRTSSERWWGEGSNSGILKGNKDRGRVISPKADPLLLWPQKSHQTTMIETVAHLRQEVWGSLWQTAGKVSAALHQNCSAPQTGTALHG